MCEESAVTFLVITWVVRWTGLWRVTEQGDIGICRVFQHSCVVHIEIGLTKAFKLKYNSAWYINLTGVKKLALFPLIDTLYIIVLCCIIDLLFYHHCHYYVVQTVSKAQIKNDAENSKWLRTIVNLQARLWTSSVTRGFEKHSLTPLKCKITNYVTLPSLQAYTPQQ